MRSREHGGILFFGSRSTWTSSLRVLVPHVYGPLTITVAVLKNGVITPTAMKLDLVAGQSGIFEFIGGPLTIGPNDAVAFRMDGATSILANAVMRIQ